MSDIGSDNGWLEAAIAWEVCASLHRQYCKGKDDLFTTRQSDFVKHAENARRLASHGQAPAGATPECLTCSDHGAVGNILTAEPCPDCTRWNVQPAPATEEEEDEGVSREQWVEQAMRVYLIAGDTEDEARECAEYQWGELDMDDLADAYDTAMSDIEGRGPAPATQQAVDAARKQ